MKRALLILAALNIFFSVKAQNVITVTTQAEFDAADSSAVAGDIIEWPDGTYADIFMDVDTSDITVRPQTPGGVIFTGASRAIIDGSNVTFTGFQYIGGDILGGTDTVEQTIITIDGSNNIISEINFSDYTCWKYMRIRDSSQFTNVSYCNFENRLNYADQNIFQIDVAEEQPGFHNVSFCSFKNFTGDPVNETNGDDGVEPIRTGSSSQSLRSCRTIIEYCYFTSCNGDDEVISGKATDCIYRYNTLENNEGEIVLRHGNTGIVYGNFFLNGEAGVRVREGQDHIIYNNYFSGLTDRSIQLQASPDVLAADDDKDGIDRIGIRVENVIIANNTFVSTDNIDLGDGNLDYDPLNTVFINNIFENTTSTNHFRDETGNESFFGNIMDTQSDLGLATVPTGITFQDPQLSLNTEGFYELADSSPAIDASVDNAVFPFPLITGLDYDNEILLDLALNPRMATLKDVGAQEYSATGNIVAPHVTEENTGPNYVLADPDTVMAVLSVNDFIANLGSDVTLYPNPVMDENLSFQFNFNENTQLNIVVYDLTGKKVATIFNNRINAGASNIDTIIPDTLSGVYLIQINALDNSGKTIASKMEKIVKM